MRIHTLKMRTSNVIDEKGINPAIKRSLLKCSSGNWHVNSTQPRGVSMSCGGVRYLWGQICLQLSLSHVVNSPHFFYFFHLQFLLCSYEGEEVSNMTLARKWRRSNIIKSLFALWCVCVSAVLTVCVVCVSAGDDPVLPSQCVSLHPAQVGSLLGLRHHVRHRHPQAVQVLYADKPRLKQNLT